MVGRNCRVMERTRHGTRAANCSECMQLHPRGTTTKWQNGGASI